MKRRSSSPFTVSFACGALALAACGSPTRVPPGGGGERDLAFAAPDDGGAPDLARGMPDLAPVLPCSPLDKTCKGSGLGPPMMPFPLSGDAMPDPNESDTGVARDPDGYLGLGQTTASFDFLWIANSEDWGRGTVSKINSRTVKEVARYPTTTCFSNAGDGGRQACDGTKGCCSRDDYARFKNRGNGMASGPHQAAQTTDNNPSRTAVDFNGDVWVANRAFAGQSSVTKIANDLSSCADRNGTPGVQTSSDVDGNGQIDTDCNRNGVPDDIADVMNKPCNNGKPQEYFGLDDECVLFTTNTNAPQQYGRPLALGRGAMDFGPADAWAGTYQDGKFFRIDGTTGQIKVETQVPNAIYGATVDQKGILWAAAIGDGKLRYIDTGAPQMTGVTRAASFGLDAYGITMDRDQNVWQAGWTTGHAYRYIPDRTNGFTNLGKGYWTQVQNPGANNGAGGNGRGIAADSRTQNTFFVWMARDGGWISRIDVGAIPKPMGADVMVDGRAFPAARVFGSSTIGVGVDIQQNIWGISYTGSAATRIVVDNAGNMTAPDIAGAPGSGCPVGKGDFCSVNVSGTNTDARPYTYSDFTGFGLRNFTLPQGEYSYTVKGCDLGDTRWVKVEWDATVPPNTSLAVRGRANSASPPDPNAWGQWTGTFQVSPALFDGVLVPIDGKHLQVKFSFATQDKSSTPKLKSFRVYWQCLNVPG